MLFLTMLTSFAMATKKIAVLEPRTQGRYDYPLLLAEVDRMRLTLNDSLSPKDYDILTRENIAIILKDMGRDISECVGSCDVETGRLMGSDYVIATDFLHQGNQIILTVKLFDVDKGSLIKGYQIEETSWENVKTEHRSKLQDIIDTSLTRSYENAYEMMDMYKISYENLKGEHELVLVELESQIYINKRLRSRVREQKSTTKKSFMRSTLILGTSLLIPTVVTYYIVKLSGGSDSLCDIYKPTNNPSTWSRQCISLNHW